MFLGYNAIIFKIESEGSWEINNLISIKVEGIKYDSEDDHRYIPFLLIIILEFTLFCLVDLLPSMVLPL